MLYTKTLFPIPLYSAAAFKLPDSGIPKKSYLFNHDATIAKYNPYCISLISNESRKR